MSVSGYKDLNSTVSSLPVQYLDVRFYRVSSLEVTLQYPAFEVSFGRKG